MPCSAKAVANDLLEIGWLADAAITPMKLQKLLYYAQGWHLALTEDLLFDEQVEAWKWGPVVRSVYGEFKEFGNSPITRLATIWQMQRKDGRMHFSSREPHIDTEEMDSEAIDFAKTLLNRVWEVYGKYTPVQLSNMTHAEGTPWSKVVARYDGSPPKGTDIPPTLIRRHFKMSAKGK